MAEKKPLKSFLAGPHFDAVSAVEFASTDTIPVSNIPSVLTGKDADTLDGYHAADIIAGAPSAHQLDGALHTVSGLTDGHFLKATGATTFGFAAHGLTYSDVGAADVSHTHASLHDAVTLDTNVDNVFGLSTQELTLDTQTANTVFSGPDTGAPAVPTFRALVGGDIPDLSGTYSITGHTHVELHDAVTLDTNVDNVFGLSTQELTFDTQTANYVFAGPDTGSPAVPTFRALVTTDIPDLSGTYAPAASEHDEVSLSADLGTNLLGLSTQELTLDDQTANTVFAGPESGAAAAPSFRGLVADDIPDLSGTYAPIGDLHDEVTLDSDADTLLALSGQELGLDTQTANYVFAGPESGGAAVPGFRALVTDDIPDLSSLYAVDDHTHAALHTQNTDTGTTGNTFTIDSDSSTGKIILDVELGAADKSLTLTNAALTDDRVITFPDETGTVALTTTAPAAHDQNASTILIPSGIGTPSYDDLQDYINLCQSEGRLTGGTITAKAPADGSVDISEMQGFIHTSNAAGATLVYFKKAASNVATLTDLSVNYIVATYSAGDIVYSATTTRPADPVYNAFVVGRCFRSGTDVEVLTTGQNVYDMYGRQQDRLLTKYGNMDRATGGVVSAHATPLRLQASAGTWYFGNTKISTNAADTFEVWYRTGGGAWTVSSSLTLMSDVFDGGTSKVYECYQNGTSLGTLTANHYGVYWLFICPEGDLYVVLGTSSYANIGNAQAASVPASLPPYCVDWARLVGRAIVKKTAAAIYSVESVFSTAFTLSAAVDHSSLSGRTDTNSHPITAISTTITNGYMIKSDGSALVVATNTDTDVNDAVTKKHSQNTDTGTTGNTFTVDSDSSTGKIIIDVALDAADKSLTITNAALTDNRVATFQDKTGTVALTGDAATAHNLLSSTHSDTTADSVVRGDIIIGSGVSPKWTRLAKGTEDYVLTMGANEPEWAAASGGSLTLNTKSSVVNGATNNLFTVAITDGEMQGAQIPFVVTATYGSDYQVRSGIWNYAAYRTGSTYSVTTASDSSAEAVAASTGTLTAIPAGSGTGGLITFGVAPTSSLAGSTATFTRATTAYQQNGTSAGSGTPRYESAKFSNGITIEEGVTNLLSENISSIETDTTGFGVAAGDTGPTRDTGVSWSGSASVKSVVASSTYLTVNTYPDRLNEHASVGTTYTFTAYVKGTVAGTVHCVLQVAWCDNAGNDLGSYPTGDSVHLSSSWQRITLTATAPASTVHYYMNIICADAAVADIMWVDGLQVEEKSYATSWQIGGTARNAETLTLAASSVSDSAGTFECWIKLLRAPGTNKMYICDFGGAANKNLELYVGTGGKLTCEYGTGAAEKTITGSTTTLAVNTLYHVAVTWGTAVTIYVNGASEGTDTDDSGIESGTVYVGSKADGTLQLDGYIDDLRIENNARNATNIDDDYDSASALGLTANTIRKFAFDAGLTSTGNPTMTVKYQVIPQTAGTVTAL